jgi:hypothetical protein
MITAKVVQARFRMAGITYGLVAGWENANSP